MVFSALVFLHNILHIHIRFTLVVASVALPDMNDCLTKCHWHAVKCLISIFLLLIAYWLFLMYLLSLSKCDTYPQYALIKLMPSNFLYGCLRFRNVYGLFCTSREKLWNLNFPLKQVSHQNWKACVFESLLNFSQQ